VALRPSSSQQVENLLPLPASALVENRVFHGLALLILCPLLGVQRLIEDKAIALTCGGVRRVGVFDL